jgi:hypothetical protein
MQSILSLNHSESFSILSDHCMWNISVDYYCLSIIVIIYAGSTGALYATRWLEMNNTCWSYNNSCCCQLREVHVKGVQGDTSEAD